MTPPLSDSLVNWKILAYETVKKANDQIANWLDDYNQKRRHSSLDRKTPDQVYYDLPSNLPMAA